LGHSRIGEEANACDTTDFHMEPAIDDKVSTDMRD
jgi:hypothetical protein